MSNKEVMNHNIPKEQFEFVQKNRKIFDQKMQGKPIGYMKDVWLRFKKNRANLIASTILLILILCSIFMPGLSGKEYIKLDEKIGFLPPRVPGIEKLGILDGTVKVKDKPVDLDRYDEELGLYMPLNYDEKAVVKDTLSNRKIESADKSPFVLHGQMVLRLNYDSEVFTSESNDFMSLVKANNPVIEVDVYDIAGENGKIEILLKKDITQDFSVVGTITEAGKHQIDVFKDDPELYGNVGSKVRLRYTSGEMGSYAAVASVSVFDDSSSEPVFFDEGYNLSMYKNIDNGGQCQRQNGEMTIASFRYNKYIAAFGLTHESGYSSSEYEALLKEWEGRVEIIPNPDNPEGWFFSEGFPIREVVKKNDSVNVDGKEYYSYEVYIDYAALKGYTELPYYLFGTSQAGRDLFSLVWVALRTSLYIGLMVTLINVTIGVVYGAISGYYGGKVDLLMQRFAELVGRIPWLVVLSILVVLFDPGIKTLLLVLIIRGWIGPASVTRMQFYRYKRREYVLASKTMGAKDRRLIFRHILPNGIGTIITSSVLSIPAVIFTEAALSYLGFGIGHGQSFAIFGLQFSGVSIGVLLADARNFLFNYPYLTVYPSIIVSILMITFNLFGNALRDAFNPSLRGVEE